MKTRKPIRSQSGVAGGVLEREAVVARSSTPRSQIVPASSSLTIRPMTST